MLTFAPLHRVLARHVPRLPSNSPPILPLKTHNYTSSLSAPLRVRPRTYAASTARSPSAPASPTGSKWNRRLRRLGIATVVGAGALWWDAEYNARTLSRNFRTIWNGAAIALEYKCVLFSAVIPQSSYRRAGWYMHVERFCFHYWHPDRA